MLPVNSARMARHTRGIAPVLELVESLGGNRDTVLKGTGILLDAFDDPNYFITLEGEFRFYRNIIKCLDDPFASLKIGEGLPPETYGVYGYALLSSPTVRDFCRISEEFSVLSMTHFSYTSYQHGDEYEVRSTPSYLIPDDLLPVFTDRDFGATIATMKRVGIDKSILTKVYLMHDGSLNRKAYEGFFGCPVVFNQPYNATFIKRASLDLRLKQPDLELMNTCVDQCRKMVKQVNACGTVKSRVAELLVTPGGRFLSIEEVANKMRCSSRTLRRNLNSEGSSYAEALKDIRLRMAKEYLNSGLKIEAVSEMLGYSEGAAFSRAFKRWTSVSPKDFRDSLNERRA